jgi:glycosyltransferase involved in cell wall biosynthesis
MWDGTGIRLFNIGRVLWKKGHEVTLLSTGCLKEKNIEVPFECISLPPKLKNKRVGCVVSSFPKLIRLIRQNFDIIHAIKAIPYATLPSFVASKFKHKKIVLDWDDWEGKEGLGRFMSFPFGEIHTAFERWIPYNVDGVIVGTNFLKNFLRKRGVKKPVAYLPNGINMEEFENVRKVELPKNSIVIVGNLSGISDLPYVLRSVAIALEKVDLNLLIIGDGNRRKEFENLAKDLGIDKNVKFLGWVEEEKKREILRSSDICLMPMVDNIQNRSRSPMKLTEYMALGCAIIANNLENVKTILNDAGLLIGQKEEDLSNAIVYVLENDKLRRVLKKRAKRRAKLFDWNVLVEKIEPFYYNVLNV